MKKASGTFRFLEFPAGRMSTSLVAFLHGERGQTHLSMRSGKPNLMGVTIESSALANILRGMFELAWTQGIEVKKKK